jgi:F0F1-type ATP synthase membrane subunit b/b'
MSYAFQDDSQQAAFGIRVYDALVKVKQELGVDELLLAIDDAKKIASSKVETYLTNYKDQVEAIIVSSDAVASTSFDNLVKDDEKRSARNIEKLVALGWKNKYEMGMTDLNARMPLAQQIISKYMANFSVKPSMK